MADGPDDPKQKADKAWRWCERQWDRAPSPSQMVEAAVTASIAAALAEALAPVLERVARLEELAQFPTLMAENDALLQKMADAPCAICNGARWVCDVSVDGASYHRSACPECSAPKTEKCTATRRAASGILMNCTRAPHDDVLLHLSVEGSLWAPEQVAPKTEEGTLQHNPGLGSVTMSTELGAKWMCEAIVSKYAPDEREFVHAFARKWEDTAFWRPKTAPFEPLEPPAPRMAVGPDAQPTEPGKPPAAPRMAVGPDAQPTEPGKPPAAPATQGIPQRGPQAPERVTLKRSWSVNLWQSTNDGFGTEYVRADLLEAAEAKLDHSQRKYRASCRHIEELAREDEEKCARLEAAERRIVDCRHEAMLGVLHEAENPSQTPIGSPGSIMSRARDIGLKAKKREHMITHDVVVARAEGREAGIREALTHLTTEHGQWRSDSREAVIVDQCVRCVNTLLAKKPEVGT